MLETIYISRHGCRQDWIDPEHISGPTGLYHDPSLSAHGLEQAEDLGKFLASPTDGSPSPEMIFTSPFYRCIQTSLPLAKNLNQKLHLEHGVMEWFSKAKAGSGLHTRPHEVSKLHEHFPNDSLHPTYSPTYHPNRRGESLEELWDRIETFMSVFIKRIENEYPDVKTISIFGHAATVIALGRALLDDPHAKIKAGTCSTSKYVRQIDQTGDQRKSPLGEWKIDWNGNTSYLPDGEEKSWNFDQVVFDEDGQVIEDNGDGLPFDEDEEPSHGLAEGLQKYLAK
ncbi:uncharacterized protein IL334_002049 [Kwoniella shivajii]|uniref:Phosphoglycerate mutase-like protein n=1 Tax=Kwoniella shivajii TaxID=564305 RepID=A0ABZ1CTL8_9TREE|nr:hypothetical protein IL334_002049 [Kwoniella shivajii]